MNIAEELQKVEIEMKALQERYLILTGAKSAFELLLKSQPSEFPLNPPDTEPTIAETHGS
jgi:hypothetical protein